MHEFGAAVEGMQGGRDLTLTMWAATEGRVCATDARGVPEPGAHPGPGAGGVGTSAANGFDVHQRIRRTTTEQCGGTAGVQRTT